MNFRQSQKKKNWNWKWAIQTSFMYLMRSRRPNVKILCIYVFNAKQKHPPETWKFLKLRFWPSDHITSQTQAHSATILACSSSLLFVCCISQPQVQTNGSLIISLSFISGFHWLNFFHPLVNSSIYFSLGFAFGYNDFRLSVWTWIVAVSIINFTTFYW